MTPPQSESFIKEPLAFGYIVYHANDSETTRKIEVQRQNPAVKPQLRLDQVVR